MDSSGLKDIIGKLRFLRSYSSLVLPVVIALAGVILFIPTQMLSGKLKQDIAQKSVTGGARKIKSLSSNPVAKDQWLVERKYQDDYAHDANRIALLTQQVTCRELLSYKIFPEPREESTLIFDEFKENFLGFMDRLVEQVNGRDCPTQAELGRGGSGSYGKGFASRRRGASRKVDETIIDVLCQSKARSASVYVNAFDLAGYNLWRQFEYKNRDEAVRDCWYWQLAYWITEDVFDSIGQLNKDSESVFTSGLKRLISVNFERGQSDSVASFRGNRRATGQLKYVRKTSGALTDSYTARVCDDAIDVVHFNISVVVSTDTILPFMQELCSSKPHKFKGFYGEKSPEDLRHNQITILETKVMSIDRQMPEHKLYRYGQDAVVRLDLVCEYIFNKTGYDEIKPQQVKEEFEEGRSTSRQSGRRSNRGRRR